MNLVGLLRIMAGLASLVAEIVVGVIIVAPALWLAGKIITGKEKFSHAIFIVVLGVVANAILGIFVHGLLGLVVTLALWVALIRHFFETTWVKSAFVAIVATVVLAVVVVVLVALGIGALAGYGL